MNHGGSFRKNEIFTPMICEFLQDVDFGEIELILKEGVVVHLKVQQNWKPKEIREIKQTD